MAREYYTPEQIEDLFDEWEELQLEGGPVDFLDFIGWSKEEYSNWIAFGMVPNTDAYGQPFANIY